MSTTNTVDIEQVPKTYEITDIGIVKNPLKTTFKHYYDGRSITIKAGKTMTKALPIAVLMAEHLAKKIVADKHEAYLKTVEKSDKDDTIKENIIRAGIPEYDKKIKDVVDSILTIEKADDDEDVAVEELNEDK